MSEPAKASWLNALVDFVSAVAKWPTHSTTGSKGVRVGNGHPPMWCIYAVMALGLAMGGLSITRMQLRKRAGMFVPGTIRDLSR